MIHSKIALTKYTDSPVEVTKQMTDLIKVLSSERPLMKTSEPEATAVGNPMLGVRRLTFSPTV